MHMPQALREYSAKTALPKDALQVLLYEHAMMELLCSKCLANELFASCSTDTLYKCFEDALRDTLYMCSEGILGDTLYKCSEGALGDTLLGAL